MECVECGKKFLRQQNLHEHEQTHAGTSTGASSTTDVILKEIRSAFKSRIQTYSFDNVDEGCLFPELFMKNACLPLKEKMQSCISKYNALKFNIELFALYIRLKGDEDAMENAVLEEKSFKTKMAIITHNDKFEEIFHSKIAKIRKEMEEFQERDSGWTLVQLLRLQINLCKFQPLKGASFIPTPVRLAARKAVINIKNSDEFCFKWAIVAAFANLGNNSSHPSTYKVDITSTRIDVNGVNLKFDGLSFPLKMSDISLFERMNGNISINVFGYDEKKDIIVGPHYKAEQIRPHHINLLFLQSFNNDSTRSHYAWIKNMSR